MKAWASSPGRWIGEYLVALDKAGTADQDLSRNYIGSACLYTPVS
jgi:hypothetical protein